MEYTLNFYEALKLMFDQNVAIRGEKFDKGVYLQMDTIGQVVMVDLFATFNKTDSCTFHKSMTNQRFRIVNEKTIQGTLK